MHRSTRAARAYFYSRPCGRGDREKRRQSTTQEQFLLTPLREGRRVFIWYDSDQIKISTHAPAGGATAKTALQSPRYAIFLLTPLREGRLTTAGARAGGRNFYSRPCGRGDNIRYKCGNSKEIFLLTPLREGRPMEARRAEKEGVFLLTPLREGRLREEEKVILCRRISTHAPAGGATKAACHRHVGAVISTHAPAGGATIRENLSREIWRISTHAPAGGATLPGGFS